MKLFSASETSTVSDTTISCAPSAVKMVELPKDIFFYMRATAFFLWKKNLKKTRQITTNNSVKLFSASETSTVSGTTISSATSAVKRVELPKDNDEPTNQDQDKKEDEDGELKAEVGFEGDVDTMKDLRKTFAGIFG